ncbi:MAG: pilin [Patescibacteria group bacterium]
MKKVKTHLIAFLLLAGVVAGSVGVSAVFAEDLKNPLNNATTPVPIPTIVKNVITTLLGFTGAAALLMFLYGGILWMTAMGEEKRIKQGWDTMTWAALGLAVIFSSYAIVSLILRAVCGVEGAGSKCI